MSNAVMGCTEWAEALDRLINWSKFLNLTPREAFYRMAKLLEDEHFGVEHCSIENFADLDDTLDAPTMHYLNMGETYATTLVLTDDYTFGEDVVVTSWGDWYEVNQRHHCNETGMVQCGYCGRYTPLVGNWSDTTCLHCKRNVSTGDAA